MDELINQKAELRVIILHYGHYKATMNEFVQASMIK